MALAKRVYPPKRPGFGVHQMKSKAFDGFGALAENVDRSGVCLFGVMSLAQPQLVCLLERIVKSLLFTSKLLFQRALYSIKAIEIFNRDQLQYLLQL